jgi:hypothetical protein
MVKPGLDFLVGIPVGVWGCGTLYWMYAIVKNDRHVRHIVRSGGLDSLLCWFLAAALWPLVFVEMAPLLRQDIARPKRDMYRVATVENAKEPDKTRIFAT